jgi:hypothetical protein
MAVQVGVCPDDGVRSLVSQLVVATSLQTALASSKLQLFQAGMVSLTPATTIDDLNAAEATYDGYTPGGVTITAWGTPYVDVNGLSVLVTAPSHQFNYTDSTTHVHNEIGGAYVADATGNLMGAIAFGSPVTMEADDDACVVSFSFRVV